MTNDAILKKLSMSKFRSKFKLGQKEIDYINEKGLLKIESHAEDFIAKRLTDQKTFTDGKQTPMRGHPVFIAQHATATCCRSCMYKWHGIEQTHVLTSAEQEYVKKLLMDWIEIQMKAE